MQFIRLAVIMCFFLLSSCLRLDDNLYNPSNAITEYKRDAFTGNEDFVLGSAYTIPENLIHLFTLNSQMASESSPTTIYATYIGNISQIATDTVILYCHGNKFHMDLYWQRAKLLANTGAKNRFGVMMLDYRGYGLSKGKSTEESLYTDVDAAMAWLNEKGLTGNRLILYGFSMGSAPATKLTSMPRSLVPSKLILEAPFASAAVMVQDAAVLGMPASFFTSLKIDNAEQIKNVQQPFLWLHGTADQFLNINSHGEVIYKNYHGVYEEAHRVMNAGHTSVPNTMGFQVYSETVLKFITSH